MESSLRIQLKQLFTQSWAGLFSATKYIHYSSDDIILKTFSGAYSKNTYMYATFFHSVVMFGFKIPVLGICQTHLFYNCSKIWLCQTLGTIFNLISRHLVSKNCQMYLNYLFNLMFGVRILILRDDSASGVISVESIT